MLYTFLDLWEMDFNATTIIPIIAFVTIIVSVLLQAISIIKRRDWLMVPSIMLTIYFIFEHSLEWALINVITSTATTFMLANSSS